MSSERGAAINLLGEGGAAGQVLTGSTLEALSAARRGASRLDRSLACESRLVRREHVVDGARDLNPTPRSHVTTSADGRAGRATFDTAALVDRARLHRDL